MTNVSLPSINKLVQPFVDDLINNADKYRVEISQLENGTTIIDAGINAEQGRTILGAGQSHAHRVVEHHGVPV